MGASPGHHKSDPLVPALAAASLACLAAYVFEDDRNRHTSRHGKSARGDDSNDTETRSAYSDPPDRSHRLQVPSIDRSSARRTSSAPDDNWNNAESANNNTTRGYRLPVSSNNPLSHGRRAGAPEHRNTRPQFTNLRADTNRDENLRYNGDINIPHNPGYDEIEVLVADSDDENDLWEDEVSGAYDLFRQGWDIPSWGDYSPSRPSTPTEETNQSIEPDKSYPMYEYRKFDDLSGKEVRLIELQQGNGGEPLWCRFFFKDLTEVRNGSGGYQAVSYAWSKNMEFNCRLYCKASSSRGTTSVLPITQRVQHLLRRFRLPSEDVVLWIDALCLNQEDPREKHYLISQMGDVYQKATRVRVWLDEGVLNSKPQQPNSEHFDGEKCIKFFRVFGQWLLTAYPSSLEEVIRKREVLRNRDLFLQSCGISDINTIDNFLKRTRWFSRRWIIQEIYYATEAVASYGQAAVSWKYFEASMHNLWSMYSSGPLFEGRSRYAMRVVNTVNLLRRRYVSLNILKALAFFNESDCSQHQDRILALLPICEDERMYSDFHKGLQFEQHKRAYYHQFAYFHLEKSNTLDILHSAGAFREVDISLPCGKSWVPDWSCKPRFSQFLDVDKFGAGRSWAPNVSFRERDGNRSMKGHRVRPGVEGHIYLVVSGIIVDYIESVSPGDIGLEKDTSRLLNDWASITGFRSLDGSLHTSDVKLRVLATTLVADQAFASSFLPEIGPKSSQRFKGLGNDVHQHEIDVWEGFCELFGISSTFAAPAPGRSSINTRYVGMRRGQPDHQSSYLDLMKDTMRGRRLFKTQSGYFGIGPGDVKAGDVVSVLYGGRTPFILRRRDRVHSEPLFCELIGDSYVYGMMDGRLVRERDDKLDFWLI